MISNKSFLLEKETSERKMNKRGQITVFIILAIIIVVLIILFFVLRTSVFQPTIPRDFEPVYSYYESCMEDSLSEGVYVLEQRGGFIEEVDFSPGSEYMPFSSHLGFLGTGIPYWYYISGNGVVKENIPSKEKMQQQLNDYLNQRVNDCDFSQFRERGFDISLGDANVKSVINDDAVNIEVNQDIKIVYGDSSWSGKKHALRINSYLGRFYSLARKVYDDFKNTMFLENYGVDVLRLYSPVDGVELGCSTKIWQVPKVRDDLLNALEANIPMIKLEGSYYNLAKKENKYFVHNIGENLDVNVNFMYSKSWPAKVEIWPSEGDILRADAVGLQEGLGIMGFCYVPYHFVYDFGFPVLIQFYSNEELFQFPVVVFIDKNQPRKATLGENVPDVVPELCQYKNTKIRISTFNSNLEPVEAEIRFKCFDTTCSIGNTESDGLDAILNGDFPQCENGYVIAIAEGYETKKELFSTISENNIDIFLEKKYNLTIEVQKQGRIIDEFAVITFTKNNSAITLSYPEQKQIELTQGQYSVKVYIYSNASLNLQGSSSLKCIDVPKSGVLGLFGMTDQNCFNLDIPSQTVSYSISGGGIGNQYITESEFASANKLIINSDNFGVTKTIEELQKNYNKIDTSKLDIRLE